jgi:glycosyltransferase involved in cell wall biosynthesis
MRVLIDSRLYGLENAGLGRYVMNLIRELQNIDKQNEYILILRKKYYESLKLQNNFKKILGDVRHYSLLEQIKILRTINKENLDLVHFPHFNLPLAYKGKFVVTIHDMLMHRQKNKDSTTLPSYLYHFKRIGYKKIFNKAIFESDRIIVPSKSIKNEITEYYKIPGDKVVITYEGIDGNIKPVTNGEYIFKKYSIDAPFFIYAGNAYPHKNLKRAIEAVSGINNKYDRKILFLIASSRNVFVERLSRLLDDESKSFIKILGFVPDSELAFLYKNSLGFVYPSLSEGFGLPGLEAMSVGTLALVSDIPVFREIYQKAAFYFNPYDFSSIQKTMEDVYELDLKKRKLMIERGKEFVNQYSWRKMAQQTLSVYLEVLSNESSNSIRSR